MSTESTTKSTPTGYSRVRLFDPVTGYESNIDSVDGSQVQIDNVHHAIHSGTHFQACVFDASVSNPKYMRITTPDTVVEPHLMIDISADRGFLFEFYEDPTINAAGSAVAIHNSNRRSTNISVCSVYEDTTTQAPNNDGTLLCGGYSGGTEEQTTAVAESRTEWILKRNEDYLVKITFEVGDTGVMVNMAWYEVTPS